MSEREQFEAWAKRTGACSKSIGFNKCLSPGSDVYDDPVLQGYWSAWQASREALKAERGQTVQPIAWLNDAYLARGVVDGEAGDEDAGPGYIPVYREPFHSEGDGWIACADRMPNQVYVVAADFSDNYYPPCIPNTQIALYGDWFNDGNPTWDDGDGEDLHLREVTHWMPLPSPPSTNHPIDTTPNQYDALGKGEGK